MVFVARIEGDCGKRVAPTRSHLSVATPRYAVDAEDELDGLWVVDAHDRLLNSKCLARFAAHAIAYQTLPSPPAFLS
jgi:hypothetical protein